MPALQRFFEAERLRRGWSIRDTAKHCKISPSKAYAIRDGDDNVEFETFENIATAFSMSPAELATAIGKGPVTDDPELAPIHARLREVPRESLGLVDRLIATLVPSTRAKSDSGASARNRQHQRSTASSPPTEGVNTVLEVRKHRVPVLAFAG